MLAFIAQGRRDSSELELKEICQVTIAAERAMGSHQRVPPANEAPDLGGAADINAQLRASMRVGHPW